MDSISSSFRVTAQGYKAKLLRDTAQLSSRLGRVSPITTLFYSR